MLPRLSLSAAPALEVKEVNGSELVGKPLAEPAAEHVEGPGDKGQAYVTPSCRTQLHPCT